MYKQSFRGREPLALELIHFLKYRITGKFGRELNSMVWQFTFTTRGGWSRFSQNAHLIITHLTQGIVFADSAG